METISSTFVYILVAAVFGSVVAMHIARKNSTSILLYLLQSLAVVVLLMVPALQNPSLLLMTALLCTIVVKLFVAPYFFYRAVKKHDLRFSAGSYVSEPMVLLCIAILGTITKADFFREIALLSTTREEYLIVAFWAILTSLFLVINRRGIISQVLGILSLENSIIVFALFAGLEQSAGLQLGITVDILIWIVVATLFTGMIYRQFGSLDVNRMKGLTE